MSDERRDPEALAFRVLATCGSFEPGFRGGGPVRSVARILDTISSETELSLVTRDRDLSSAEPYPGLSGRWVRRGRARVFYLDTRNLRQWLLLRRELQAQPYDLLYVNSLWDPTFTVVPVVALRLGLFRASKVLVAPRGELSPGALSLKAGKKRLFLKWWGPLLRKMDVEWHASTDRESVEIKAVCPWARVVVVPNAVSLPAEPLASPDELRYPIRLVFISRISPKKNLDLILRSLSGLSKPVDFDIYGPREDAVYWSRCRSLMNDVPRSVRVMYRGELAPDDVRRTFSKYDGFVFPTLGENFGHVIAESLSASCPVICSDATPWTPVLASGGGSVLRELSVSALAKELERLATLTASERWHAREAAGRAYRLWRSGMDGSNVLEVARLHARSPQP